MSGQSLCLRCLTQDLLGSQVSGWVTSGPVLCRMQLGNPDTLGCCTHLAALSYRRLWDCQPRWVLTVNIAFAWRVTKVFYLTVK